ncbi:MAG: hypothetical protein H7240_07730 [Glaciimonas sp.]|nr:hypothetical protein [Glaciimonas sp.]
MSPDVNVLGVVPAAPLITELPFSAKLSTFAVSAKVCTEGTFPATTLVIINSAIAWITNVTVKGSVVTFANHAFNEEMAVLPAASSPMILTVVFSPV